MVSSSFEQQRFLPPHAGGPPVAVHAASPMESVVGASSPAEAVAEAETRRAPAPFHQLQETLLPNLASSTWLQGPLRDCARSGSDDGALARSLLDAGAATEHTDMAGRSALHWAASRGNISVVRALLDAGADGRARDGAGKTPLHCAALAGHAPVVEALLDSCGYAAQNLRMHAMAAAVVDGATTGAAAAKRDSDYLSIVDARNSYGSTALHRAAFNGRDSVVVALLKGGASVNVIGRSGRSALHLACRNAHPGCIEILLAWGADESATAKDGSTPWSELAEAAEDRPPGDPNVMKSALLLNRARGTRAWGRRGWLVMLKAKRDFGTVIAEQGSAMVLGHGEKWGSMEEHGRTLTACSGSMGDSEGNGGWENGDDLAGVACRLLAIGEEGCFRLVLSFL